MDDLEQTFSDFIMYQNHLENLVKHIAGCAPLRVADSVLAAACEFQQVPG